MKIGNNRNFSILLARVYWFNHFGKQFGIFSSSTWAISLLSAVSREPLASVYQQMCTKIFIAALIATEKNPQNNPAAEWNDTYFGF